MSPADLPSNMAKRVRVAESGCWEWQGAKNSRGYGCVAVNGKSQLAHRRAFELLVGPIPPGLQIDHLCRVQTCCNPEHLEAVTPLVNKRRGLQALGYYAPLDALRHNEYPEAMAVGCPTCNAEPGRKCRALAHGRPTHKPHVARTEALHRTAA